MQDEAAKLLRDSGCCGHEFVQQAVKGASLLIAARIDFVSSEAKSEFNAKFKLKGPAFSVAGELKKASEEFKEKATISISAYQKGGDVGRLGTAFASSDGSGGEVATSCESGYFDEGGSCKQRAAEAPRPKTTKAICKEERTGRIVNSGDKSITNKCLTGRVIESICTCDNGLFSNPCQTSNLGSCQNGGFNPRLIDH